MRFEDDDPIYCQGWRDGERALLRRLRNLVAWLKRRKAALIKSQEDVIVTLHDPEKLMELMALDPGIESAMVAAVLTMLMVAGGVTPKDLVPGD